jgi:hypothetical protein
MIFVVCPGVLCHIRNNIHIQAGIAERLNGTRVYLEGKFAVD